MKRVLVVFTALFCSVVGLGTCLAQTSVTFQDGLDGYAGTRDTKLLSGSPDTNFGDSLDIEVDGSPDKGALLYWDVSAIPVGSIVTEVDITVNVFNTSPDDYEVYRSLRSWNEDAATWNEYDVGMSWETAGGQGTSDRDTTILGSLSAGTAGARTFSLNDAGIAVVQAWVEDPSSNRGFIVQDYVEAADGIDFDTREVATVGNRPALGVTYYPPGAGIPPVASFVADPPGGTAVLTVEFDASASSDFDGSITAYNWDFGDGGNASGVNVSHDYTTPGLYTVALAVIDDDAESDSTAQEIRVTASGAVEFAVLGDFGEDGPALADVASEAVSWSPDFVITAGDNNYPDGEASTIDANIGQHFSDYIYPYSGAHGSTATTNRFFPSLGNHDWHTINCLGSTCTGAYFDYFTLPSTPASERYYEFVWGDVHFFAIDSDTDEPDGTDSLSVQAAWLQSRLGASSAIWKVVYFHHAAYSSSSNHGSTARMQWPFADWGADVVIGGHDHTYERIERDGILYFVNGLGGRSIYAFGTPINGSQSRYNDDYGAMRVAADSTRMLLEFVSRAGAVVDSVTILNTVAVDLTAYLEGPYSTDGDSMLTDVNGYLPLNQPFDSTHFSATPLYHAGPETVGSMPADVVGWVLVQLRTGDPVSPPMDLVSTRAALLKSDGSIVDTNGSSALTFEGVADGAYYAVIFHRNHLGIMSSDPIPMEEESVSYDFTSAGTNAYGASPMREVEEGVWALFGGDENHDGHVTVNDFGAWLPATKSAATGFQMTDFDLDGMVTVTDFGLWLRNTKAGASSKVPD